MKKTLIALAAVAATSAAFAQSSVTLYGILDANYGTRTTTLTESGVGYANTLFKNKVTGLSDGGPNGISTSRWGVRGTEDLGSGMKANFVLETALSVNDGVGTGSFQRRSLVGLSGGFGSIDLGREYTPAFSVASASDVTGTDGYATTNVGQGVTAEQLAAVLGGTATDSPAKDFFGSVGFQIRRSNSINYTSPNFSGVVVKAQISRNSTKSATATTAKDNGLGMSATYSAGPLMLAAAFDQQKGLKVPGTPAIFTGEGKTSTAVLAGTYDFGMAKLFANFHQTKLTNAATTYYAKGREYNFGVQVPMGAITLLAGVGQNRLTVGDPTGSVAAKGTDYMLGANYALSKRTSAYFRTGTKDSLKLVDGTDSLKVKTTGYHFGVRHAF